jgi:hypothetical protein
MLRCVELKLGSIADSEDCRPIGLVNSAATLLFVYCRVNKFTAQIYRAGRCPKLSSSLCPLCLCGELFPGQC